MSKAKQKKRPNKTPPQKKRAARGAPSSARSAKPAAKAKKSAASSRPLLTVAHLSKTGAAVKGNKYLTAAEAREKRDLLLRLRDQITGQINFLATDNISRSENDEDISYRSEEQGTDNFDRDFALNRVSLDQDILFEIDEALNRLVLGTYGVCESCGRGIEKLRMKAVPYSRMCVACKSQDGSNRKIFRAPGASETLYNADKTAAEPEPEEE
ncbi:MAG: TraR/DksA C4-type zinc finger protein [Kiritimatiellae bacterium]|nr:TraR/DksA C4-type zinc finger protein [Kiritimatiellia bacterium]